MTTGAPPRGDAEEEGGEAEEEEERGGGLPTTLTHCAASASPRAAAALLEADEMKGRWREGEWEGRTVGAGEEAECGSVGGRRNERGEGMERAEGKGRVRADPLSFLAPETTTGEEREEGSGWVERDGGRLSGWLASRVGAP